MSTDYRIGCYTCKEVGPIFASASISYGYKIWDIEELRQWLGHRKHSGDHEHHDLRIAEEFDFEEDNE